MKTQAVGAVSVLALSATGAYAQDNGQPLSEWTGPYIGVNLGVAILDGDADVTGVVTSTLDLSSTGVTFGGTLGYNWQLDQFVIGVEGDINYVDVNDSLSFLNGKGTATVRGDYDWFATIRGRAGLAMNSTLFYLTGGVAFIDSDLRLTAPTIGGPVTVNDSEVLAGYALGFGLEHKFSQDWSLKAEYLYMNFESHSATVTATPGASARLEPELHVVRAGLNYHFCTGGRC